MKMSYAVISALALSAVLLALLNDPYRVDAYGSAAQLVDPSGQLMLVPYQLQCFTSIGGNKAMLNFHLPSETRIEWQDRTSSYWITGEEVEIKRGGVVRPLPGKGELRDQDTIILSGRVSLVFQYGE